METHYTKSEAAQEHTELNFKMYNKCTITSILYRLYYIHILYVLLYVKNVWKGYYNLTQSSKKTIVFIVIFLEKSENFLNFTKISNKFGEFLSFPRVSIIFWNF